MDLRRIAISEDDQFVYAIANGKEVEWVKEHLIYVVTTQLYVLFG